MDHQFLKEYHFQMLHRFFFYFPYDIISHSEFISFPFFVVFQEQRSSTRRLCGWTWNFGKISSPNLSSIGRRTKRRPKVCLLFYFFRAILCTKCVCQRLSDGGHSPQLRKASFPYNIVLVIVKVKLWCTCVCVNDICCLVSFLFNTL